MSGQVLTVLCLFYTIYATLFLLADTGLYTAMWHRSILANFENRTRYNPNFETRIDYEDNVEDLEGKDMNALGNDAPIATLDRQKPRSYGLPLSHTDANYVDCTNLKKAIAIPNVQRGQPAILQQILSDHTLNYFKCILTRQLSPSTT